MRTKSGTFTTEYGNDNVTKTVDAVKNVAKKTVSAVKSVVTNVAGKVSTAAKAVTQTVKTVVNTAKTVAGIARTDGLKNALSGLPAAAKATAWQGKVIQAAAKAAIQADSARSAQELAETKAEARQIVADWAGGVYEEFSPRNQKIIDDTVEKVRELLANGASPAEIKRVIRGACTEVAKNVGETTANAILKDIVEPTNNWLGQQAEGMYKTFVDPIIGIDNKDYLLTTKNSTTFNSYFATFSKSNILREKTSSGDQTRILAFYCDTYRNTETPDYLGIESGVNMFTLLQFAIYSDSEKHGLKIGTGSQVGLKGSVEVKRNVSEILCTLERKNGNDIAVDRLTVDIGRAAAAVKAILSRDPSDIAELLVDMTYFS